jgi:hypothetical protein
MIDKLNPEDQSTPPTRLEGTGQQNSSMLSDDSFRRVGRQALNKWHEDHAADPIPFADEEGALPSSSVPIIFPVVLDANVIRSEVLRMARTENRTILASAAGYGVLRPFCARHVVQEVNEHCREWADVNADRKRERAPVENGSTSVV